MRHEGPRAQPTSRACWDVSRACRPDVCVPGAVLSPVSYWTGWLRSLAAKTLPSHVRSVRGLVPVDLGQAQALRICLCAWQAELLTPPIGGSKCLPTKLCSRMSPSWHLSSEPAGGPLGLPWDKLARGELSLAGLWPGQLHPTPGPLPVRGTLSAPVRCRPTGGPPLSPCCRQLLQTCCGLNVGGPCGKTARRLECIAVFLMCISTSKMGMVIFEARVQLNVVNFNVASF